MTKTNQFLKYVELQHSDDIIEFTKDYQEGYENGIVFLIRKDIFSENRNKKEEFITFLKQIRDFIIVILDCSLKQDHIDFIYEFDMCYCTENGKLTLNEKIKENIKLQTIIGRRFLEYDYAINKELNSIDLLEYKFVNNIVHSDTLIDDIEGYLKYIVLNKTKNQVQAIKKCFVKYKQDLSEERLELVKEETKQFCKLALAKHKELEKYYDN